MARDILNEFETIHDAKQAVDTAHKVKIGIIGTGWIAGNHIHEYLKMPDVEVVALADLVPGKAEAFGKKYGCESARCYLSGHEMLENEELDGVSICTYNCQHAPCAIDALEHGCHVLLEKPFTVTLDEAIAVMRAEKKSGKILSLGFQPRMDANMKKIKEIVQSGEMGAIKRTSWIVTDWYRTQAYYDSGDWRATWSGEGGGVLLNQDPHQLDLWQWICGTPVEVTSVNINGAHRNIAVENDVTIVTKYANGATGSFITCTHDAIGTDRLEIDFSAGKIVVENSNKATVYKMKKSEPEMNATMDMMAVAMLTRSNSSGGGLYDIEEFENNDAWGVQHGTVMANFASHVLFGTELLAPGADGIMGVRLANASQLSAWTGKTVSYPCDEAEYNAKLNELIAAEGKFPVRD